MQNSRPDLGAISFQIMDATQSGTPLRSETERRRVHPAFAIRLNFTTETQRTQRKEIKSSFCIPLCPLCLRGENSFGRLSTIAGAKDECPLFRTGAYVLAESAPMFNRPRRPLPLSGRGPIRLGSEKRQPAASTCRPVWGLSPVLLRPGVHTRGGPCRGVPRYL